MAPRCGPGLFRILSPIYGAYGAKNASDAPEEALARDDVPMAMRYLITGASGFVGRHMVALLRAEGHDVVAWGGPDVTGEGAGGVSLDLLDHAAVGAQDLRDIDAVVHLAGLANVADSFDAPARYVAENPGMQIALLETLLAQGCSPRIVLVSTGGVYRPTDAELTEESEVGGANPYTISKLTQELVGDYYARRGLSIVTARPFNHVGPGQAAGYLVSDVALQLARVEREGGGRILVGDLRPRRDYTDVRDVVRAYLALAERGREGETYNVCSGRSLSGHDIVERLSGLCRAPVEVVVDEERVRPTEVMHVTASNRRLREDAGWAPQLALEQTLADVMDEARERTR